MVQRVLVRGGGDLASAVIQKVHRSGYQVVVCEIERPKVVRRTVSFANAIYEGQYVVEGIESVYLRSLEEIEGVLKVGKIPVLTLPEAEVKAYFKPHIFVDATLSKRPVDYQVGYADVVVGLGPSIEAGVNANVVIETSRGHDLGRLIFSGFAKENTHIPGDIGGYTHERVLHAPCSGVLATNCKIGDYVTAGDVVMTIGGTPLRAEISGVIRGLIHPTVSVTQGLKVGDIDPRGTASNCYSISDKGRNIAGGVLEAILCVLCGKDQL